MAYSDEIFSYYCEDLSEAGSLENELVQDAVMRNALAHGYFKLDDALVWTTIQSDLPMLYEQIKAAEAQC